MIGPTPTTSTVGRARVFVVEDESLIALDLMDRLGDLGYEPCGHAACSEDARRQIPRADADLVLMDIRLGDGPDGIETCRLLGLECDTPVVFLTAYSDAELLSRAGRVRAAGYILKPCEDRDLRVAIDLALARRKASLKDAVAPLGIITTCMHCRRVRVSPDRWTGLEEFLTMKTGVRFSHGYCPNCFDWARAELEGPVDE